MFSQRYLPPTPLFFADIVETNQVPRDSDDENAEEGDEEEDEAEWRKRRFERETFLMEQKVNKSTVWWIVYCFIP